MKPLVPGVMVVKLGGSLAGSAELTGWLRALDAAAMPWVIVPGGGPFADAVRLAQAKIGFDDVAAHEMAMLAMKQYGVALASLCARAVLAASEAEIAAAFARGLLPVWTPGAMALAAPDIPASWDITSDSLAAWLAGRIGAKHLLLVKQVNPASTRLADLTLAQTLDPAFGGFLARSGVPASVAGPADLPGAAQALASGNVPGMPIALS